MATCVREFRCKGIIPSPRVIPLWESGSTGCNREWLKDKVLELCDGLDQVLIEGYVVRTIRIVDDHVRQADKEAHFLVDRIRDAMAHWRNEKVPHVGAIHRTDADANLLAFRHNVLLPVNGVS